MPIPRPMHCVDKAYFLFSLISSSDALPVILDPVAPRGWPNARAPPSKFTLLISIPKSFIQAIDWEAKASLISTISIWFIERLALFNAYLDAPIGPKPIKSGSQPSTAVETILPSISKLFSLA